jgi:hypothetical protein
MSLKSNPSMAKEKKRELLQIYNTIMHLKIYINHNLKSVKGKNKDQS